MHKAYKNLRGAIYQHPLALLAISDKKLLKIAEDLVPYSTGIEIECRRNRETAYECCLYDLDRKFILESPDLMEVNMLTSEIRFRLPEGIKGIIALYTTLELLKTTHGLNPDSGIHFHIDCTDLNLNRTEFQEEFARWLQNDYKHKWVLDTLMSWNYTGLYNSKCVSLYKGNWVAVRKGLQTIEFRICKMSFDYNYIIKKIIHCQNIVRKIKADYKIYVDKTS